MAFNPNYIGLVYAAGEGYAKRWSYITLDTLATVLASGYFTSFTTQLSVGDFIEAASVDDLDPRYRTITYGTLIQVTGK